MGELPLDDPRWWTIKALVDLRQQQTGDLETAIRDLQQARTNGKLGMTRRYRAMRWNRAFSKYDVIILSPDSASLKMVDRKIAVIYHRPDIDGWLYFGWKPDFDRLYSGGTPVDEPVLPIDRAVVVLRYLYPTKAKMPRSLKAATKAVNEEYRKRGWQLVASPDTVHRAAVRLGYRAPRKRK